MILADTKDGKSSLGAGSFVSTDGQLITCYHVIADASKIRIITTEGWTDQVVVQATNPSQDLATLRVTGMRASVPAAPDGPPVCKGTRRSAALGAGLVAALDRFGRFIDSSATLHENALNELTRLGNEAIERYRRAVDLAVFRSGSQYRLDSLEPDTEAVFVKALDAYGTRAEYYEAQFDALNPQDAIDNLTKEIDRYFARLPQSAANTALRDKTLDQIGREFGKADAVDAQLASRRAVFGDIADSYNSVDTLEDLRRDIGRAASTFEKLLQETEKTTQASAQMRVARSVVESLFEAK